MNIKDRTTFEMLSQLKDYKWTWRATPRGVERSSWASELPTTGTPLPLEDRVLFGRIEKPYVEACLRAQLQPQYFTNAGIMEIFHGRKVTGKQNQSMQIELLSY